MTSRSVSAVTVLVLGFALVLLVLNGGAMSTLTRLAYLLLAVTILAYTTVGALIARRQPLHPIAWIFVLVGLALALTAVAEQYAVKGLVTAPGSLPGVPYVTWLGDWGVDVAIAPLLFVFLLFPNGRALTPRWRPLVWVATAILVVGTVGWMIQPHTMAGVTNSLDAHHVRVPNPFGVEGLKDTLGVILGVAGLIGVITAILCVVSMILRLRRARGEGRQQVRWLAYAGATDLVLFVVTFAVSWTSQSGVITSVLFSLLFVSIFLGTPVACGIAILKYRSYDLDIVVKKTVVFAILAAFITLVYVLLVVVVPAALVGIGTGGGFSPIALATTVVVALAFQPVRERARRLADKVVYGSRATPYEVLSDFAEHVGETYSTDDVLPRMAQIMAAGTGAREAGVWLRTGNELRRVAAWPQESGANAATLALDDGSLPRLPAQVESFPVRHQDELLGALTLEVPASDPLTPTQERLVRELVSQAGLLLRNVRLIDELRASRQRIVTAQDARAKALERNIHDGAQQQLVALSVKLGLARSMLTKDPANAADLLGGLQTDAQDALDNLRDLARGIYPPLLADQGLVAALDAQARKSQLTVAVEAADIGRYPQEIEAAVYFCALEALQNVAKYAGASRASVQLAQADGHLSFAVQDDGVGFDTATTGHGTGLQGMADRLEAIGGSLSVRSEPGNGTSVEGRIPVPANGQLSDP